tara:strand:+ start:735 stop:1019 length:285 start_codon:yes stop_codon:yes gene_type:complete
MEILTSADKDGKLTIGANYRIFFTFVDEDKKESHIPVIINLTGANASRGKTPYYVCTRIDATGKVLGKEYHLSKADITSRLPVMNEELADGTLI